MMDMATAILLLPVSWQVSKWAFRGGLGPLVSLVTAGVLGVAAFLAVTVVKATLTLPGRLAGVSQWEKR